MFRWKNILLGLGIALLTTLLILAAKGSSEIFIYNNF